MRNSLAGTIRFFPSKPREFLQCVRKDYSRVLSDFSSWNGTSNREDPAVVFVQILRDAWTLKSIFPRLREFIVGWEVWPHFFEHSNEGFGEKTEEMKAEIWLHWMRRTIKQVNVIPMRGVRLEFSKKWTTNPMLAHEASLNVAYEQLLAETAPFRDEAAELEESGRKLLEQTSSENRKQRKARRRQAEMQV